MSKQHGKALILGCLNVFVAPLAVVMPILLVVAVVLIVCFESIDPFVDAAKWPKYNGSDLQKFVELQHFPHQLYFPKVDFLQSDTFVWLKAPNYVLYNCKQLNRKTQKVQNVKGNFAIHSIHTPASVKFLSNGFIDSQEYKVGDLVNLEKKTSMIKANEVEVTYQHVLVNGCTQLNRQDSVVIIGEPKEIFNEGNELDPQFALIGEINRMGIVYVCMIIFCALFAVALITQLVMAFIGGVKLVFCGCLINKQELQELGFGKTFRGYKRIE